MHAYPISNEASVIQAPKPPNLGVLEIYSLKNMCEIQIQSPPDLGDSGGLQEVCPIQNNWPVMSKPKRQANANVRERHPLVGYLQAGILFSCYPLI